MSSAPPPSRALDGGLALGVGLGALALAAACGALRTLAQDDGYLHLVVARTLAEHGVWGVGPGDAVSASAAPAWTLLLSPVPSVQGAVVLAAASAGLTVLAAGAWLGPGLRGTRRVAALVGVVLAGRVLALPATGLEHGLQGAVALGLLAALARDRLVLVPGLAALLLLLRLDGLFLLVPLAVVLAASHRTRALEAVVGGGALGLALLAAGMELAGLSWQVPSLLCTQLDPLAGLADNLPQAPELALLVLAAGALSLGRHPLLGAVALAGLLQLALGRVGNLFRYEAWLLVALAVGLLRASASDTGLRRAAAIGPVGIAAALGLGVLAQLPADVSWQDRSLGRLAELVATPGAPGRIGIVNGGQTRWESGAPLVNLGCLTSPGVPACADGHLAAEELVGLVEDTALRVAVLPRSWSGPRGAWPRLAHWTVPSPWGALGFDVHQTRPEPDLAVLRWLHAAQARTGLDLVWDLPDRGPWSVEAAAHELATDGTLGLYSVGTASVVLHHGGPWRLEARGTPAAGRPPRLRVLVDGATAWHQVLPEEWAPLPLELTPPATVQVVYDEDLVDDQGGDRNVFLRLQ